MTRYDLFRRRIAPIAFVAALGLLVHDTCTKQERTHAEIVIDLGEAAPRVQAVNAELLVDGEVIGTYHQAALPGMRIGRSSFKTAMPDETGELRIDVDVGGGRRRVVREVHVHADGATVTVPIGDALR